MKSKDALNKLQQIVGDDFYAKVLKELAGVTVYFPENYTNIDKSSRNDSLKDDYYTGGYEVSDLAIKYNLSISSVYKIIEHRE